MYRLMKPLVLLSCLFVAQAAAAPVKLTTLPITIEPNAQLLMLTNEGLLKAFPNAATRPNTVFMTDDRKVNIAVEWRKARATEKDIPELFKRYPAVLRAQVPTLQKLDSKNLNIGGNYWAQFVFTIPGKNDEQRREILFTSAQGRLLVITVASALKDYNRNETIIRQLINSVRVQ